jgi:hypothetical protein
VRTPAVITNFKVTEIILILKEAGGGVGGGCPPNWRTRRQEKYSTEEKMEDGSYRLQDRERRNNCSIFIPGEAGGLLLPPLGRRKAE